MKASTICLFCRNSMIHHISKHRTYWFCRNCRQEMPGLNAILKDRDAQKYKRLFVKRK